MLIDSAMVDFVEQLRRNVDALQREFGVEDLVAGRKAGRVPRRGIVGDVPFLFHGKGLRFELDERLIGVDFCEDGFGVDWWRFRQFLAPLDERSRVEQWHELYVSACAGANARTTTVAGRRLVWKE